MSIQDPQWESFEVHQVEARRMDALHAMPLVLVPLETTALTHLKLVKNYHLESVVEVYTVRRTRSAQVNIENLPHYFGWPENTNNQDLAILRRVGALPAFDIFSLRRLLREMGMDIDKHEPLKLAVEMADQRAGQMLVFTRPLIAQVFGDENIVINTTRDLMALFEDADSAKVLKHLQRIAAELGIRVEAVPNYLENYGDMLMSLAFFRESLDELAPIVDEFLGTMNTVRDNQILAMDDDLMNICNEVENDVNELTAAIAGRFKMLDRMSGEIGAGGGTKKFREIEKMIGGLHSFIGGVLCGLTVKMTVWDRMFPDREDTSPAQLADFIKYHMKQSLETMQEVRVPLS